MSQARQASDASWATSNALGWLRSQGFDPANRPPSSWRPFGCFRPLGLRQRRRVRQRPQIAWADISLCKEPRCRAQPPKDRAGSPTARPGVGWGGPPKAAPAVSSPRSRQSSPRCQPTARCHAATLLAQWRKNLRSWPRCQHCSLYFPPSTLVSKSLPEKLVRAGCRQCRRYPCCCKSGR